MDTVFFFGVEGENGYLSNWFLAQFPLEFNGKRYDFENVEQAMMASKAMLFNDIESFGKILKTPNPKSVKSLGRKVKNFDGEFWDKYKKQIVKSAVKSKFVFNPELKEKLLETEESYLAEDSPYDKIWGIGTKSLKHKNDKTWPGQNLLGVILMELRQEFNLS